MDHFITHLKASGFSEQEMQYVLDKGVPTKMKKGQLFSHAGKVWDKLGILKRGILFAWNLDEHADKRIPAFYFMPDNYLVVDFQSFLEDTKSGNHIEAIDDCELVVFNRDDLKEMSAQMPYFMELRFLEAKKQYLEAKKLIEMFQHCNATEKIKIIQERAPYILKQVPYYYIASFLGIHRNTFAEALKKMSR